MIISGTKKRRIKHCPIPKSTFTTYMDEGLMHYRAGSFRKALYCYDHALELTPNHRGALVARSQCHLKLGDAETARRDAETAFNTGDKVVTYMRGLVQYAEALFALGLFEKALIQFHRGNRLRRDMEIFRIGIQKCQESIRQAIIDHSGTQIEDLEDVLPLIKAMEALDNPKSQHCCIRPDTNDLDTNPKLKPPSKARARWVAREVLGSMFLDMEYLKKFLHRPDIKADQGSSPVLRQNAHEALNYLKIREQFWKQQNPMYSRKYGLNFNNDVVLHYEQIERDRQEASRRIKMDAAEGAVLKNISLIEHALEIGRARDCQLECDRTMRQMKEITVTLLPRKAELLCQVLHYKGLAFIKLKSYDAAVDTFMLELDIATQNKKPDIKARAMDHLGKSYALKQAYAEAAEVWESRVPLAKTALERSYLFHEIGRCYLEMTKLDIGRYYAANAYDEAVKINDSIWAMNAKILLGQIELKAKNHSAADAYFRNAEDWAMKCGNNGNATLLREAQQCLKAYIDKLAAQEAAERAKTEMPIERDDEEQE